MLRPIALSILTAIGALCVATFGSSCTTTDQDQSPHTKKVRESNMHSEIMRQQRRRRR